MPRPSRNIDQLLIAAALELLPNAGTSVLTIRQVCQHAGVNLGMFHYHFKTRDVFLRAVLRLVTIRSLPPDGSVGENRKTAIPGGIQTLVTESCAGVVCTHTS